MANPDADEEESGERELAAELVALTDEATEFDADADREGSAVTVGERELALLIELFTEDVTFILFRAEMDEVND